MQQPRVLLADDHAIMVQGLGRLLEGEAEIVATASDGQQLVERARQHRPDIIVSDINMPGMSGLEFLPIAKAARPDVPVIMITAYGDPDTKRKALEGGASGLLTKPIDFSLLREEIDNRLAAAN